MKLRAWPEAFAILAGYLVLTLPMASAATIRTYDPEGLEMGLPLSLSPSSIVRHSVSVDEQSLVLDVAVTNATPSVNVEGTWLYMCGNRNPQECIDDVSPSPFSGDADASYDWADVSGGSPETANILFFSRVNSAGRISWLGFWKTVVREPGGFTVAGSDIGEIAVHATSPDIISTIRQFISSYHMIPANPGWVSMVVFSGASSLFKAGIEGESDFASPNKPSSGEVSGSSVYSVPDGYTFVLPDKAGVKSPVTLFMNPTYTCGMFGCENGTGESQDNCCLDCGCGAGQYCDSSYGCRDESMIGLGVYNPQGKLELKVENCYETNQVSVPVEIINAPSGYSVTQSWCRQGGKAYVSCSCVKASGDRFVCTLTVPPAEDCGSGEFRISNNGIRLRIAFLDGSVQDEKLIETPFPDITVGSFVCGSGGCEESLGESQENCCLDCGCPSGYCNTGPGAEPGEASCRSDPSSADLHAVSTEPSHFYDHPPSGDTAVMNIVIGNSPRSLSVDGVSCNMGCTNGTGECESTCSVSCSRLASGSPDTYNMSCAIGFMISGYDPNSDYKLSPELGFQLRYTNGTAGEVSREISRTFPSISIGAHWCGDGQCGDDERSSGTCCFDCGCGTGNYCDTKSTSGPTEGDGCRNLGFEAVMDSVGPLALEDTTISHDIPIEMHVNDYPSGTQVVPTCTLAGGDVECVVSCTKVLRGEDTEYHMDCRLTVPWMDYVTSDYLDAGSNKIVLTGNSINFSIFYNDGPEKKALHDVEPLGTVSVKVTTNCGINGCEPLLGEDEASCCRDCGCAADGEFCYMGASHSGECVSNDTIDLRITGSEPDPWECIIGKIGGECRHLRKHILKAHIVNAPPGTEVLEVSYRLDGRESSDMNCSKTAVYGDLACPFIPETGEGSGNRTVELLMSIGYTITTAGGEEQDFVKDLSASGSFSTSGRKSDALIECENGIDLLREQINRIKSNQNSYGSWGMWYFVVGAAMVALGIYLLKTPPCDPTCKSIAWSLIMTGGLMIVTGLLSKGMGTDVNVQVENLQQTIEQKKRICSSTSFEDTARATEGMGAIPPVTY